MKNKRLAVLALLPLFIMTSCNNNNYKPSSNSSSTSSSLSGTSSVSSTSSSTTNSVSSSSSSSSSNTSTEDIKTFENYDAYIDKYSQSGHLYIHYLREGAGMDEYNEYGLWLWPVGKQGALFAASQSTGTIKANTSGWMKTIGVNGSIDQAGVCADIDLNSTDYVTGREQNEFTLAGLERIGYLVVRLSSMTGGTHWTSDGGGDGFIEDVSINTRANGAIHVFLKKGSAREPSYVYSIEAYSNPVTGDTTGQYRSLKNVDSSTATYPISPTSEKFSKTGANGYQLFIPTFADSNGDGFGDLRGVINKLDYLESLNIDTLWLSPFLKSNSYHGYDTVDYYEIDSRFGSINDLRELIYKAHEKGIKVLMDLVINHSSTSSIWFKKAQKAEKGIDSEANEFSYRDLFHFKYKGDTTGSGKKVEEDPDWYKDGESDYYYYAKFASDMPEFNYDAQITRDLINEVAIYWLGFGIDGYRLDAIKHIYMVDESEKRLTDKVITDIADVTSYDEQLGQMVTKHVDYSTNTTKNIAFWKEFAARIKAVYPDTYLVAENFDGWDKRIAPYYQCFDSQLDFNEYYHNLEYVYLGAEGKTASDLATENTTKLNQYFKEQRSDFINATFTSNHDVSRAINHINSTKDNTGKEVDVNISGTAQQINRAKVHAAITILQPGVSFIYYGDELGMSSNTKENDNAHTNNLDRFYRQAFKWANESERCYITFGEGYNNSYDSYNKVLADSETQGTDENSMLSFYRAITAIKGAEDFPLNGAYTGYSYDVNKDIYHYIITPKEADDTTYKFFINTGGKNGTGTASYSLGAGEELVYAYNTTGTTINPYGVVVIKTSK